MTFTEIRSRDAVLAAIATGVDKQIPGLFKDEQFGTTASVLSHLVSSLESLKDGYLLVAETGNIYASNVILRVFLEHALKAVAIFLDGTSQSNCLADGYLRLAECEAKAYLKALNDAGIDEAVVDGSPLRPLFAKAKSLSRSEREKLEAPFQYKSLIKKIREETGSTVDSYLLKIIPNYSELSAFVHGGPAASIIIQRTVPEQKLLDDAELVVSCFYSIKRYLLMFVASFRSEFVEDRDRLDFQLKSL